MLIEIIHNQADCYGDDSYSGDCELGHKEVTLKQLLNRASDFELQQMGLVRLALDKTKPVTEAAAKTLRAFGWSRPDVAKNREEKKAMEEEYYILDENGKPYWMNYNPKFAKIDLDDLKDDTLIQLANGARIVQKVSARSVLKDSDYKKYLAQKKKKEDAAERAKKSKETKEQNKLKKQIENAKKILMEVGELK